MKTLPMLILCGGLAAAAHAVEPLAIRVQANRSDNGVSLHWNTVPGRIYRVEFSSSLFGPWELMERLPAAGDRLDYEFEFTAVPGAVRYFRIGTSIDKDLRAVVGLPGNLNHVLDDTGSVGANAVFGASTLGAAGQRLVTEGTLTEEPAGWTYDPSPAGQLEVHYRSGTHMTFVVDRFEGDFSGDATTFLQNPHIFDYRVVLDPAYDLTFQTQMLPNSCNFNATISGTYWRDGITYTCDVIQTGIYCVDNTVSGYFSVETDYTTFGVVTAPGFSLDLQHRRRFELITSNSETDSTDENWNNSTLTLGTDTYQWINTKTQKSFKNGRASDIDTLWEYWKAYGDILKNGEVHARYQRSIQTGYIRFLILLPAETIELEAWPIY